MAEARRLADAKQFGRAASVLRNLLAQNPDDRAARSLLARVLAWDRHYDESLVEYERLLAARPGDAANRAGYARVLAWSGRHDRALREFRRAIRADSTNLETRVGYARALSWSGDLAGSASEYQAILRANPDYGDAWLGLATVARWRGSATASDRFLVKAEGRGADPDAFAEERRAVDRAMGLAIGGGWTASRERQYVSGPDFTLESAGPFAYGRATVARAADVTVRAAWIDQFERADGGSLNYDLDMTVLRADVALLRGYPIQVAGGVESRKLEADAVNVAYPLLGDGDFTGWNARVAWYVHRFTASLTARREFLPIKSTGGPSEIFAGGQTVLAPELAWQWSGRGTLNAGYETGDYSDGNDRTTYRGGAAYRIRAKGPSATLDYGIAFTDFTQTSASYFTPLESVRHAAGLAIAGYAERAALDYGTRYQFSYLESDNFGVIRTNTWSAYLNAVGLGSVPLGVEGSYSRDNNDYETWFVGLHAAGRW
jgi:tetratricopeptide (TPR) repeat protein